MSKKYFLGFAICLGLILSAQADETKRASVAAADDARVTAMKKVSVDQLQAVFSDELRYAHSNGVVDTKASLIEVLTSGTTKYVEYDYVERSFTFPAPDIALMAGQARIQAETAKGKMDSILSFLAVWRLEQGQWRFLAWQSCKLPPANP
ncbi:protein of unknown function [Prosthecobacter debontii]|uniref:DUF4440 domain-containing protein n=1 Tax=Prosthecobacter debontii TaxID=48467 RepID=A0A1T4YH81_9BACT|nr:nuclear transport factor 2 family protein [Prosthecobacter debontii]SKB01187.1 protein of unknown function [Prosthecobacter debontii]